MEFTPDTKKSPSKLHKSLDFPMKSTTKIRAKQPAEMAVEKLSPNIITGKCVRNYLRQAKIT